MTSSAIDLQLKVFCAMPSNHAKTMLNTLSRALRGKVVLANLQHALTARHLTEQQIADFLNACAQYFENVSGLDLAANADEVIEMMVNVANVRKDLRFLRQGKPTPVSSVSTIVRWETAVNFLFEQTVLRDKAIPMVVSDATAMDLLELEKVSGAAHLFAKGAHVGSPGSELFWVAPKERIDDVRSACVSAKHSLADRLRDLLGLPDHNPGEALLEFYCPGNVLGRSSFAAPTFIEGGSNTRFKARPDGDAVDNWGRTADLALVWPSGTPRSLDGLPEAVVARTDFRHDLGWGWCGIGFIKEVSEGRRNADDPSEKGERDDHYARLVCDGINLDALIHQLATIMDQHATGSEDA